MTKAPNSKRIPTYRLHKVSGRAVTTLPVPGLPRGRDVFLGKFGSPESKQRYAQVIATWMDGAEGKRFRDEWRKTGKKLDMGACCVRFKSVEDVPLEVVGAAIKRVPAKQYIALYEKMLWPERLAKRKKKQRKK